MRLRGRQAPPLFPNMCPWSLVFSRLRFRNNLKTLSHQSIERGIGDRTSDAISTFGGGEDGGRTDLVNGRHLAYLPESALTCEPRDAVGDATRDVGDAIAGQLCEVEQVHLLPAAPCHWGEVERNAPDLAHAKIPTAQPAKDEEASTVQTS